jgi:hypothetical protein
MTGEPGSKSHLAFVTSKAWVAYPSREPRATCPQSGRFLSSYSFQSESWLLSPFSLFRQPEPTGLRWSNSAPNHAQKRHARCVNSHVFGGSPVGTGYAYFSTATAIRSRSCSTRSMCSPCLLRTLNNCGAKYTQKTITKSSKTTDKMFVQFQCILASHEGTKGSTCRDRKPPAVWALLSSYSFYVSPLLRLLAERLGSGVTTVSPA